MKKNELKKLCKQFIKFGLVGVSNTLLSYGIYYLLIKLGSYYILAHIVSFIISVLNSFLLNDKYVFTGSNKSKYLIRLLKTYTSYGITFVISTLLLTIQVEYLNVPELIAPLINLIITIPLNFILNKYWAFNKKEGNNEKN